jgi:hypothetical protein
VNGGRVGGERLRLIKGFGQNFMRHEMKRFTHYSLPFRDHPFLFIITLMNYSSQPLSTLLRWPLNPVLFVSTITIIIHELLLLKLSLLLEAPSVLI